MKCTSLASGLGTFAAVVGEADEEVGGLLGPGAAAPAGLTAFLLGDAGILAGKVAEPLPVFEDPVRDDYLFEKKIG